jgi:uncharacterized protein
MNVGPGTVPPHPHAPYLRVSTAERDRAVDMLQTAFAEGRIDATELDTRIGTALAAVHRSDLAEALRGLPIPEPTATPTPPMTRPTSVPDGEDRLLSAVAHWSGFFTLFVGPAIIAATKGRTSPYVREQAMEATNFQITFLGAVISLGLLTAVTFGLAGLGFPVVIFGWLGLMGVGGLAAAAGNRWRYPISLRLF